MKTISVKASHTYSILLGENLLASLGEETRKVCKGKKATIISDSNVYPLYGGTASASLTIAGFAVSVYVIPAGEQSKSFDQYGRLLHFLAEEGLTRPDCVVALGGGVTGDLAGFAAATYLRGITLIQVPTTLLSVIDSSVGGKTGIDLPAGKNLVGAFYQPSLVLADTSLLKTLPKKEIKNGAGELIKYGVLTGGELFSLIEAGENPLTNERMLELCILCKKNIVEADEKETGIRKLLNLGHTLAHAAEKLSSYTLPHGEAVALGIYRMGEACVRRGKLSASSFERISAIIKAYGFDTALPYPASRLAAAAANDKKSDGGFVTLVTIEEIGKCVLEKAPVSDLEDYLI